MRHKCRYGGCKNSLIGSIHTIKIEETCFLLFLYFKHPKLSDTTVGQVDYTLTGYYTR